MPSPTLSDIHVNRPLSQISVAYLQQDRNFVADRVFPIVPVPFKSDRYYTYHRDAWFRSDATERAPGTESAGTGWTLDNNSTYSCRVYAEHTDISEQIYANADSVLNMDRDGTMLITKQLQILKESIFITNFFGTGLWTGNGASDMTGVTASPGANQFLRWDQAGSTPIEDVQTQILNVAQLTGYRPNKLVIGPYVWKALRNNAEIIDRVKYVQKGFLTEANLAEAFGVDEVLVPMATQNTAVEPAAPTLNGSTLSMSFMYPKSALLVYAAPNPGLMQPSGGYTFAWTGLMPFAGGGHVTVSKFYLNWLKAWRLECEMAMDLKQIASDMGVFFTTAVS
jgi:hypothetical protein